MSDLYLAYFVPQGDLCVLYCMYGIDYYQESFHQIVLCLNMSKMNYSVHLNWSLNQRRLLSHIELNLNFKDHYCVGHGGHGDPFIRG